MKRILVAVDFSPHSEAVVKTAAELAATTGGELCIVHLAAPDPDFVGLDAGPQSVRDSRAEELRAEHKLLQQAAETVRASGIEAKGLLIQAPTVDGILEEAEKFEADVIVMGSHAKGPVSRAILGSVSEAVLRRSSRPVLVVPDAAIRI